LSLSITSLCHQIPDGNGHRLLLSDLCLDISQRQCVALMGDSGSGKTTLLNLIAGLLPIQKGNIHIDQRALANATETQLSELRKTHLGIIFQQYNLLPGLSVQANLEFSARLAKRYDAAFCLSLARQLNIDNLLNKFPASLSGGEMQRVAIARALSARPKLLLADEPTGNLDDTNSALVVNLLIKLSKDHHTPLLMVTHSTHLAQQLDKTYTLSGGKITLTHRKL
jgi:putative ABC transport system ATP-binding protein